MDLVKHLGGSLARTVASTAEIISDKDLRKKAQDIITREAGQRLRNIQSGVQNGAGQLGVRLQQGPRHIQAVLLRLQQRLEEQRLQASLQAERDAPVDVQVGPVLYEDAPQELRSRMWMALLNDPRLTGYLSEERALEKEKSVGLRSNGGSDASSGAHRSPMSNPASPFAFATQSPFGAPAEASPTMPPVAVNPDPFGGSQPSTPSGRALSRRLSSGSGAGLTDRGRSLANMDRNSLRLRLSGDGQEISRKVRAGSLADMDAASLRGSFRINATPQSPTALMPHSSPRGPVTPRSIGDIAPGTPLTPHRGGLPDTPRSLNRSSTSPFASYTSPQVEPASPGPAGLSPFSALQSGGASPSGGSKLDIDEADRRAEAAEAARRIGDYRQSLHPETSMGISESSSMERGMSGERSLVRSRSRSLPREAGPGARDVGSARRNNRGFMTRLRQSDDFDRRDVLSDLLAAAGIEPPGPVEADRDVLGDLQFDASGGVEERGEPLGLRGMSLGREGHMGNMHDDAFSRRTLSQCPASGPSSRLTQYTFTRVKPAARRRTEGEVPGMGTPSPLTNRIGEMHLPGSAPSPLRPSRHRRTGSVDSLHGDLTPRSVASDFGGDFSAYIPPDGQRFRSPRPRSPFRDLASSRTDQLTPGTPRSVDSDPGHMSPMWSMSGVLPSPGPSFNNRVTADPVPAPGSDDWEMVQGASSLYVFSGSRLRPARLLGKRMNMDKNAETLRQRIMEAIWEVQWPISAEYAEGSRYNTLLQISIGQEDVDEVISRDIHRTFPEHPQFGFQQGQQALFRVLKAYSLHDLEVGYCQGMAFVAGVLLMYLPEEPAFKGLCRLMDRRVKGGCALRDLYMPGLEGLKRYLRMFEWLMGRLMPAVKEQLEAFAALPVLYASQWFLTAYSCPFPSAFSCRVIDIMLTEQRGDMLLRAGLAIMANLKDQLLQLDDFEDIITYLKVEPLRWSAGRMRQVLNFAVSDFVQDDMIRAAQLAIDQGYEGTLSRRGSSLVTAAEAAAAAVENQRKLEEAIRQLAEKEATEADPGTNPAAARAARPPRPPRPAGAPAPGSLMGEALAEAQPQMGTPASKEEMEDEYMAMVMSLDTLWTGQGRA